MGTNVTKATPRLSAESLLNFLARPNIVCIVGPDFSMECGAPHFRDILTGVWSGRPSSIDPFTSESSRQAVLEWFLWRMQLLSNCSETPGFRALAQLQNSLNLQLISQCVDGLAWLSGITKVLEPYGNVFSSLCPACKLSQAPQTPTVAINFLRQPCPQCGGFILPNISMFGWNGMPELREQVVQMACAADAVIAVGCSPCLSPFQADKALPLRCRVLEVQADAFLLRDGQQTRRGLRKEISEDFEKSRGIHIASGDQRSMTQSLHFLLCLYEAENTIAPV